MCIPLQDFKPVNLQTCTDKEKIDWSKSIADIDKQLYTKYKITDTDELDFISGKTDKLTKQPKFTSQDLEANYINSQLQQQSK